MNTCVKFNLVVNWRCEEKRFNTDVHQGSNNSFAL